MTAILSTLCFVTPYLKYFVLTIESCIALCVFGVIAYTIVELEPSTKNYTFFAICIIIFSLIVADIFTIANTY